ncbi:DUF7882 family protein [Leucobacter musarum]|uniref:DUF7882 family protein n=1 Tax=Leucobacter musarum TaxID=1930747 RepID=UPI0006A79303|nr:hypothetical protein [Leucobacter musarum]
MGKLVHGSHEYDFEDRLLAHLQFAIGQKLRRGEGFFLSWQKGHSEGDGRTSAWLSPHVTIAFHYSGSKELEMSKPWLRVLGALAHTPRGLVAISEHDAEKFAKTNPDLV